MRIGTLILLMSFIVYYFNSATLCCESRSDLPFNSINQSGAIFTLFSMEPLTNKMLSVINDIYMEGVIGNKYRRIKSENKLEISSFEFYRQDSILIYHIVNGRNYDLKYVINPRIDAMYAIKDEHKLSNNYLPSIGHIDVISIAPRDRKKISDFNPGEKKLLPFRLTGDCRLFTPSSALLFTTFNKQTNQPVQFPPIDATTSGAFVRIGRTRLRFLTISETEIIKSIFRRYPVTMLKNPDVDNMRLATYLEIFLPNEKGNYLLSFYADKELDEIRIYEINGRTNWDPYKAITSLSDKDKVLLYNLLTGALLEKAFKNSVVDLIQ